MLSMALCTALPCGAEVPVVGAGTVPATVPVAVAAPAPVFLAAASAFSSSCWWVDALLTWSTANSRKRGDHGHAEDQRGQAQGSGDELHHTDRLDPQVSALAEYTSDLARARERLISELRTHALHDRGGDAHERGARRVLRGRQAGHPAPRGLRRPGHLGRRAGVRVGRDGGWRHDDGRRPGRLRRARRRSPREGVLRAQGGQGARVAAAHRGSAAARGGSLRGGRGRRHHRWLDARGDRGAARGGSEDLRGHQRSRSSRRGRCRDRAGRGRAVRGAHHDRRHLPRPTRPPGPADGSWRLPSTDPQPAVIRTAMPGDVSAAARAVRRAGRVRASGARDARHRGAADRGAVRRAPGGRRR